MVAAIKQLVTAEQFEQFEDKVRLDLIEGELHPMPPMPGEEHGALTYDFSVELGLYVRAHGLGQCYAAGTRFLIARDPDTAIAPDWAFVAKARLPHKRRRGFVPLVPDAVLEVRSPSDAASKVQAKMERWSAAGVRWALELDPSAEILTVYRPGQNTRRLTREDTLTGDDVLPGFAYPLRNLFPDAEVLDEVSDVEKDAD